MSDGKTPIPVSVDPATGAIIQEGGSASLPSTIVYGQQTVTNTATALPNKVLTQGVILESLSTNTVSIFIGDASVTVGTGVELQIGAALSAAISNLDVLYVICASSSPVITWLGS
jgi:hypothetical protein